MLPLATLLGGIGLFLLGMRLMTDGLKFAAGPTLRDILARSTATKLRGLLSGALITSVVQSSSAVTVAIIGFVNAGLMNLSQALTVLYGSNIGTTATAWLVATIGFHVNVKAFALPAIGLGMLLRLVHADRRTGALGEALAGFGVFFLGIDILRESFAGLGESLQLGVLAGEGVLHLLLFVGAGFLLTLFTQSSSAALAITLTAAAGGIVPLIGAAAMVIGANVGTTSTAVLSVIGATPNAKRVAAAHVIFNLVTGVAALLLLSTLLGLIAGARGTLGMDAAPAAVLAVFHTVFNLLGVALMLPATGALVRYLEQRFVSAEEDEARPRYLDRNVLAAPMLALHALVHELRRIGALATRAAAATVADEQAGRRAVQEDRRALDSLVVASGEFVAEMQGGSLSTEIGSALPNTLRITRYYSEMVEAAERLSRPSSAGAHYPAELAEALAHYRAETLDFLAACHEAFAPEALSGRLADLQAAYQSLKSRLLHAGAAGQIRVPQVVDQLDRLSDMRRMAEQAEKAARYLSDLEALLEPDTSPAAGQAGPVTMSEPSDTPDTPARP